MPHLTVRTKLADEEMEELIKSLPLNVASVIADQTGDGYAPIMERVDVEVRSVGPHDTMSSDVNIHVETSSPVDLNTAADRLAEWSKDTVREGQSVSVFFRHIEEGTATATH